MFKFDKTGRGFSLITFEDVYGSPCSVQRSSIATEDAVWIGVDSPQPKVRAKDARHVGVYTHEAVGWVDFPIPPEVSLVTRMHLTAEQVEKLLPVLEHFVKNRELPTSEQIESDMSTKPTRPAWKWSDDVSCYYIADFTTPPRKYCLGERMVYADYGKDSYGILYRGSTTDNWGGMHFGYDLKSAIEWLHKAKLPQLKHVLWPKGGSMPEADNFVQALLRVEEE